MKEIYPFPIICLIIVKINNQDHFEILIQRRTKQRDKVDYYGFWELPQGKIRASEDLATAINRELYEETTLVLNSVNVSHNLINRKLLDTNIESFNPVVCVLDIKNHYLGLGIVVQADGIAADTDEATEHKWAPEEEVLELIAQSLFFPLNVPIILKFFEDLRYGILNWN